MSREADYPIDEQFLHRWSPRSFEKKDISRDDLFSILEAARWAPSCMNEQPWFFIYPDSEDQNQEFVELLVEPNQVWAKDAAMIIYLFSRRTFKKNHEQNRHAAFDAGAAWMALSLQANKLNLVTHAMAGIKLEEVYTMLNVDENESECLCAIAIGHKGPKETLPEKLQQREAPSPRQGLQEFCYSGKYKNIG